LIIASLGYWGAQWKYAATIGTSTIFSPRQRIERQDFGDMLDELTNATRKTCGVNPSSRMLFDDGDYASPYLKKADDRLDSCAIIRETNVTSFSRSELDDCDAIFIHEHSPFDRFKLQMYDTLSTKPWIETARWMSSDGQFGFALYRHPCFASEQRVKEQR
jgi:hypothetical protein